MSQIFRPQLIRTGPVEYNKIGVVGYFGRAGSAAVQWLTSLLDWSKRKDLTIQGAVKTATFTNNFTTSDGHATSDATKMDYNATNDNLDCNADRDGSNNCQVIDLQHASWLNGVNLSDNFIATFTLDVTSFTQGGDTILYMGFSDGNETEGQATVQKFWGVFLKQVGASEKGFGDISVNEAVLGTTSPNNMDITVDTHYIKIVKDGTSGHAIISLNSDLSNPLATVLLSESNLSGLRYFKISNHGSSSGTGALVATIDDLVVYNGTGAIENLPSQQTASLEVDLSSATGWTSSSANNFSVDTGNTEIDFDVNDTSNTDEDIEKDINGAVFSDTSIVHRFIMDVDTYTHNTSAGNNDSTIFLGSSTSNHTVSQDAIGIRVADFSGPVAKYQVFATNVAAPRTGGTSADFTVASLETGTKYWEIIKNGDIITANVYSDSAYSVLIETQSITVASITGLRYWHYSCRDHASNNGEWIGSIHDIKIWDNVTEVNPTTLTDYVLPVKIRGDTDLQRKTAEDYVDDLTSYSTEVAADTVIVPQDRASGNAVDIANDVIDFNFDDNLGDDNSMSIDLTSVSDTKWTFDLTMNWSAVNINSRTYFGLSSDSSDQATAKDFIGMLVHSTSGSLGKFKTIDTDGATLPYAGDNDSTITTNIGQDYFIRIRRLSATAYDIQVFADKAKTVLLERITGTCASTTDTLRYILFANRNDNATTAIQTGTIKDLHFWNGTTNPVDQETATLVENFTGTDNWNVSGTDVVFDATNDDISWNCGSTATSDGELVYDLETLLSLTVDNKWVLQGTCIIDNHSNTSASSVTTAIGLSDSDETVASTTNQAGIAFVISAGTGVTDDNYRLAYHNAGGFGDNANKVAFTRSTSAETIYFRLIRDNDTVKAQIFSDSAFSVLLEEQTGTISTAITGLKYLAVKTRDQSANTLDGRFTKLEFFNGVASPNANGRKIVFTDNLFDTAGTEYASKTISYDPVAGDLDAEVRIPSLTMGADTIIQMYYEYGATNPDYVPETLGGADAIFGTLSDQVIEDFTTYTVQADANSHWIPNNNEAGNRVDLATDNLDFNFTMDATNETIVYDLGTNVGNKWVLRFKANFSTLTASSGNQNWFGVSDSDQTVSATQNQQGIGVIPIYTAGVKKFITSSPNGSQTCVNTNDDTGTYALAISTDLYFTITRVDSTNYNVDIRTGSHTGTDQENFTSTCDSQTALRYFKIACNSGGAEAGVQTGTIDDVEFYNNTTTITPARETKTYNATYKGVYHLNGNALDSTVNANDGTETAIDYESQNGVGAVFNATTSDIDCGTNLSLDDIWGEEHGGHIRVKINPKSDGESNVGSVMRRLGSSIGWFLNVMSESGGFVEFRFLREFTTTFGEWRSGVIVPINEETIFDLFYNDGDVTNDPIMLVNGVPISVTESTTPVGTAEPAGADALNIGSSGGGLETFDGFISNIKILAVKSPTSSGISSYNAEKENTDMITTGTEVTQ